MNDQDKTNLEFIINTIESENWDSWIENLGLDEVYYALELLRNYRTQLELDQLEYLDTVTDVSDAQVLLARF